METKDDDISQLNAIPSNRGKQNAGPNSAANRLNDSQSQNRKSVERLIPKKNDESPVMERSRSGSVSELTSPKTATLPLSLHNSWIFALIYYLIQKKL